MTDTQITIAVHAVTQRDAAHVLWVMRLEGGVQPGNFVEKLIEAAIVADIGNQERLSRGFEGLVAAVLMYRHLPDGVKRLQAIASGHPE